MPSTSGLGPGLAVQGLTIGVSSNESPVSFTTIVNVENMSLPISAEKVDVTNVGMTWRARIPTLLDIGPMTFDVFWQPSDDTFDVVHGLRYLLVNKLRRYYQFAYPDGLSSADIVAAYVTKFDVTGKVGDVFHGSLELTNDGTAPTLV